MKNRLFLFNSHQYKLNKGWNRIERMNMRVLKKTNIEQQLIALKVYVIDLRENKGK